MIASVTRTAILMTGLLLGCMVLSGWLGLSALRGAVGDALDGGVSLGVDTVVRQVEAGVRLGLAPQAQSGLPALLETERRTQPLIDSLTVYSGNGQTVLAHAGAGAGVGAGADPIATPIGTGATLTGQKPVERIARNDLGDPVAVVRAVYTTAPIEARMETLSYSLLRWGGLALLPVCLIGTALLWSAFRPLHRLMTHPATCLRTTPAVLRLDRTHAALADKGAPPARWTPSAPALRLRLSLLPLRLRLSVCLALMVLAGSLGILVPLIHEARTFLDPDLRRKADGIAQTLTRKITHAVDLGIPANRLEGVDALFADTLAAHPDLARIRLVMVPSSKPDPGQPPTPDLTPDTTAEPDLDGGLVWHTERGLPGDELRREVRVGNHVIGWLSVAPDRGFVLRRLGGIALDLGVILLIVLLAVRELEQILFGRRLAAAIDAGEARLRALQSGILSMLPPPGPTAPAHDRALRYIDAALARRRARHQTLVARAKATGDTAATAALDQLARATDLFGAPAQAVQGAHEIRAPLFLFMVAHELSRPFLPGWAARLPDPTGWTTPDLAAGLPLTVFMIVVALLQLPLAGHTARWGRGLSFRAGAVIGAFGFGLAALSETAPALILSQGVAAVGFALVFVSCQGHILDTITPENRVRSFAVMVGAIVGAGLCGPAIGGALAATVGEAATFAVMGGLALCSLLAGILCFPVTRPPAAPAPHCPSEPVAPLRQAVHLLGRFPVLTALLVGCALPAKLLLFAVCFYLIPLQMTALGASPSDIGRMQMIYPILTLLLIPAFSALSRHLDRRLPFVVIGAVLAAGALWLPGAVPGPENGVGLLTALLVLFGVAQALSMTPQGAAVGDLVRRAGRHNAENTAYGLYRLIERGGSALGPMVAAGLLPICGFDRTLGLLGGLSVLGALTLTAVSLLVPVRPPDLLIGGGPAEKAPPSR